MNIDVWKYCPSTLAEGFSTYSATALKHLFDGKKVNHVLPFDALKLNEIVAEKFRQNSKSISISGAQFKQSLLLEKNKLRLTREGESGHYILKPVPPGFPFYKAEELPANEHLTMQIAKQVYDITTAECALIFFTNGEPAYITKRFDYNDENKKMGQEDFAAVSEISKEKDGEHYRTSGSYEDVAATMKKYMAAYAVEVEKFFSRVVFNFLFSNADAHLKNFSVQETVNGDHVLTPAYDLINTYMHIPGERVFALSDGLFKNGYATEEFKKLGYYSSGDFYEFGLRIGVLEKRIKKIMNVYCAEQTQVLTLIDHSYLSDNVKAIYKEKYFERLSMLNGKYLKSV